MSVSRKNATSGHHTLQELKTTAKQAAKQALEEHLDETHAEQWLGKVRTSLTPQTANVALADPGKRTEDFQAFATLGAASNLHGADLKFEPAEPWLSREANPPEGMGDNKLTIALKEAQSGLPAVDLAAEPRLSRTGKVLLYTAKQGEPLREAATRARSLASVTGEVQFSHPDLKGTVVTDGHRFLQSAGDDVHFPLNNLAADATSNAQALGEPVFLKHRILFESKLSVDGKGRLTGHLAPRQNFESALGGFDALTYRIDRPIYVHQPGLFGGREVLVRADEPILLKTSARATGLKSAFEAAGDGPRFGRDVELVVDDERFLFTKEHERPVITRVAAAGEPLKTSVLRTVELSNELGVLRLSHPQLNGVLSVWRGLDYESAAPLADALKETQALAGLSGPAILKHKTLPAVWLSVDAAANVSPLGIGLPLQVVRDVGRAAYELNRTLTLEAGRFFSKGEATIDSSKSLTLTFGANQTHTFAEAMQVATNGALAIHASDVKVLVDGHEPVHAAADGAIELPRLRYASLSKENFAEVLSLSQQGQVPVRLPDIGTIISPEFSARSVVYPNGTVAVEQTGNTLTLEKGQPIAHDIARRLGRDVELRGGDYKQGNEAVVVHPDGSTTVLPAVDR